LATPMGETIFKTFQQAETVLGEEDIIAIIKHINSLNSVLAPQNQASDFLRNS